MHVVLYQLLSFIPISDVPVVMPRSTTVTEEILRCWRHGIVGAMALANELGVHIRTIHRHLVKLRAQGYDIPLAKRGPRPKLSAHHIRELDRFISSHPSATLSDMTAHIRHRCDIKVSTETLRSRLKDHGYVFRLPRPDALTSSHKAKRVQFARAHLNDVWDQVWSFDESYFRRTDDTNQVRMHPGRGINNIHREFVRHP